MKSKSRPSVMLGIALAGLVAIDAGAPRALAVNPTASVEPAVTLSTAQAGRSREATGFYTTGMQNGRWTLFDPEGKPYFCLGLNHVNQRFGVARINRDLAAYHFNSYGWMDSLAFIKQGSLSYVYPFDFLKISIGLYNRIKRGDTIGIFRYPDPYDPAFRAEVVKTIAATCAPLRDDRNLIAYMLGDVPVIIPARDNPELNWAEAIRRQPEGTPGKKEYLKWIRNEYQRREAEFAANYGFALNAERFPPELAQVSPLKNEVYQDDVRFALHLIADFYDFVCPLIRQADPNHLLFSHRLLHDQLNLELVRSAARHVDAIAVQPPFSERFDGELYRKVHQTTGKPIFISDHHITTSSRLKTRADSARAYPHYLQAVYDSEIIIGYGFCSHLDSVGKASGMVKPGLCDPAGTIHPEHAEHVVPANRQLLAVVAFGATGEAGSIPPSTYLLNGVALMETRRRALAGDPILADGIKELRRRADRHTRGELWTVTSKPFAAPSGDKHDYVSLASYFWPDADSPTGLPYISRDGQVNPETHRYDRDRLDGMCEAVHTLALAYYLSGQESYAKRATAQLRTWFLDEQTKMNPHLQYAQMIRGKNEGSPFGLIETEQLTRVVDGVALLRASPSWPAEDDRRLRQWFAEYLTWLQTSKAGKQEANARQNHGTYYDVQTADFALFVGERELARAILENVKTRRIAEQIEPDGSQPRELVRTKSRSYAMLNLSGMFRLARLGEHVGMDLWNYRTPDERGIRGALDWLVPYATGKKPWEHQQMIKQSYAPMVSLLRQAAMAYQAPAYEQAITQLQEMDREILWINLLHPSASSGKQKQK